MAVEPSPPPSALTAPSSATSASSLTRTPSSPTTGRQFYLDCFITGSADYVFGNATAVFQNTELNSIGPGYITAQSRTAPTQTTGFVFLDARVTSSIAEAAANNIIGLGHPWRPYARVVFLSTTLPANVMRAGWNNWGKPANQSTAFFAEYNSSGSRGLTPHARPVGAFPYRAGSPPLSPSHLSRRLRPLGSRNRCRQTPLTPNTSLSPFIVATAVAVGREARIPRSSCRIASLAFSANPHAPSQFSLSLLLHLHPSHHAPRISGCKLTHGSFASMLIVLVILILVFGFGGARMGPGLGYYGGGGISLILTIVLILLLLKVI